MLFEVQFMTGGGKRRQPSVIRTANFEADELYSVVSRIRVILSTRGYEPYIDAFRILADGNRLLYSGQREAIVG